MRDGWVWICDWGKFQHYTDRNPKWIKNYLELLAKEDYLDLTSHRRGVLHGLWMSFAVSRGRLRADTAKLSKRLRIKITTPDLEALNHAGFIEILDSTTLSARLQDSPLTLALARADAGSREQQQSSTASKGSLGTATTTGKTEPEDPDIPAAEDLESPRESEVQAAVEALNGSDRGTFGNVMPLASQITTKTFREIMRTVETRRRIKNKPGLLMHLLQNAVYEQRIADSLGAADAIEPSSTEKARRDPDHYISVMAPHLTEHDLERYLFEYVKDQTRHEALTALWHDQRKVVA